MGNKKRVAIIGSGFSGISAAAYAAKAGHEVHVFEKNSTLGGRARQFSTTNGYLFDMGPSWYWMPDIMEKFFLDFGYTSSDFYELVKLDPQFEMVFSDEKIGIPGDYNELRKLFENIEPGSALQLDKFMKSAAYKYEVGMGDFVQRPSHSWTEFFSLKILKSALQLNLLTDFKTYVGKFFKNKKLISLMEFPVIFLGAMPKDIPALYSLMNYGGYKLGTWYPMGGFGRIVEGMAKVAKSQGVNFYFDAYVQQIMVEKGLADSIVINGKRLAFDAVISSADYHYTEQQLLEPKLRNYTEAYWKNRVMAPSCLIFYLGFNKKLAGLKHHTLFFENDLQLHSEEIFKSKKWPTAPLFYVCCPSKTDDSVAPEGHENVFLLMPIAAGLEDTEEKKEQYFKDMLKRLEKHLDTEGLSENIDFKRSYCVQDFVTDYNAYLGNAYGLANTLKQTAAGKPKIINRNVKNLIYTGQLTVPGPGVPPAIISGKIAANEI